MQTLLLLLVLLAASQEVTGSHDTCPMVRIVPERMPDLTTPRSGHNIFYANGELTLAGGHTTNFVPTHTAEYYADGAWHEMVMAYSHDHSFAVATQSGEVIIGGGNNEPLGVGHSYFLERYHPQKHAFEGFGCLDRRRVLANATQLADGRVIIAGNHYADDAIACYDGRPQVQHVKAVRQCRSNPYILRVAADDALILSGNDIYDHHPDTVWVDRLSDDAFRVPLLEQWRVIYTDQPFSSDICSIGDEETGDYAYLLTAADADGQVGIVVARDTCFSLLPTVCPIPMQGPFGPIAYKGPVVTDRERQRGYLMAVDSLYNRQYILAIDYARTPATLTLYYTDQIEHATITIPIVTPDGDLILAGGIPCDNYKPLASVWLYRFATAGQNAASTRSTWLWVLVAIAAILATTLIAIYTRRKRPRTTAPTISEPQPPQQDTTDEGTVATDAELLQRICQLMEQEQIFRQSRLKQSDVAATLNVSTASITSCIANCRGITFAQLIAEYRVHHAQQLISNDPDIKLAAVITESGFTSESTFFRTFKAVTGLSPKEWLAKRQ